MALVFTKTARFYDAVYSFKDYPAEAELVRETIDQHLNCDGRALLDVACGTGKHLELFSRWFDVYGVDLDSELLAIAAERTDAIRLHRGDMRTFDMGRQFDVVTCLFSSVAYMTTMDDLQKAVRNMADHVKTGGVLVIEPFLYPESYSAGFLHFLHVDEPDLKLARMSRSEREGNVAVLNFEYLIATPEGVFHDSEQHRLGLFTQAEYETAMAQCDLKVDYDPVGPMGRGLFVAVKH
jgi:ubiquinone/menaquinone biosynthesis C-methylase UbiE